MGTPRAFATCSLIGGHSRSRSLKRAHDGRYHLGIDNEALGSYATHDAAADDVYQHVTGYFEWDELSDYSGPTDIHEWDHA